MRRARSCSGVYPTQCKLPLAVSESFLFLAPFFAARLATCVQAHPIARIVVFEAQYGRELQPYKMQAVELRKLQTVDSSANNFVLPLPR